MLKEYSSKPRDEAVEKIERYIITHELKPNMKLPSERDMCAMWGLNRTTLRSAIQRLIDEGKLYQRRGSGTYAAPPKMIRNLQDLKPLAEVAREMGKTLTTKVLSAGVIESNKQTVHKLHLPLGHKLYEQIRLRIVDETPYMIETSYVDYERLPGLEEHDFGRESLYRVLEQCYHVKIVNGEEKLEITYTTENESEILGLKNETPVFFLTGVVSDENEIPVEYFKSVVRADLVHFASVLTR